MNQEARDFSHGVVHRNERHKEVIKWMYLKILENMANSLKTLRT
ncbi:MAG TPA: hypothetical protein VIK14_12890 [Ignavibacteria bacterium]